MNAYLSIHDKVLNSVKAEGIKKTIEDTGEDNSTDEITLSDGLLESKMGDIEFNERTGCLSFSTELAIKKDNTSTDIGYFSDEIEIDLETASDIVNYFMKKLGKLKTVLEATKE
jgi:hypothetical protein